MKFLERMQEPNLWNLINLFSLMLFSFQLLPFKHFFLPSNAAFGSELIKELFLFKLAALHNLD